MRRALLISALSLCLGILSGEMLTKNFSFRRWLGRIVRHDELQALVSRHGIYERDIARAWQAELWAQDAEPDDVADDIAKAQKQTALDRLITDEKLNEAAAREAIDPVALTREMNLLRWQMPDEKAWNAELLKAGTNARALRNEAARHLRARAWIEERIAPEILPNENECRRYFDSHRAIFVEPLRFRASHLFLAAPEGYPTEVIETKRMLINSLARRLANGESFPALVAEFSEDEASKTRGGDLGYFAEKRMLPAVFEAAQKLQPGEISPPIRSRLGFHILRLTESRPARALTFDEARPEILAQLEDEKRAAACARLLATLP